MGLFDSNNQGGGLFGGSTATFGSPTPTTGQVDLTSSQGLLNLALSQGGAVAEAAQELVHPKTSMLSTIGNGFKKAFRGFVDVISVPSQVVAGALSSKYTVSEAIKDNISPSDVIFGGKDPNATTMKKVGNFFVRTAADILLDPLTYVTFGAGSGIAGLRATPKVSVGLNAAKELGVADEVAKFGAVSRNLSEEGTDIYKYLKNVEKQEKGLATAFNIAEKTNTHTLAKAELKKLLDETVDAPLNVDLAKRAITRLLEASPQLTETLLDKGGIKFFGKSILSGQRIGAVAKAIPGMTWVDSVTSPVRNSVEALFNPAMVKVGGDYMRLPEEYVSLEKTAKDLAESMSDDRIRNLADIARANNLTAQEAKFLTASIEAGKMPSDPRLANVFKQIQGFGENDYRFLNESGIPITWRDKHVPHILVKTEVKDIPFFKLPPSIKTGAAIQRTKEGTIFANEGEKLVTLEQALVEKNKKKIDEMFTDMQNSGFEIFDSNVISAHAARTIENVRAGTTKQFIKSVAEQFGSLASEAPEGWVKINLKNVKQAVPKGDALGFDELGAPITMADSNGLINILGKDSEEVLFHPAVAKRIEDFMGAMISDEATNDLLKKFDSLQNLWKASVTSIFPAFHGRNAISNVFLHFMDLGVHSLNPALHGTSVGLIYNDRLANKLQREALGTGEKALKAQDELYELLNKKVFTDATGYEWTFGELRQVIKDKNVAFTSKITGSADVTSGDPAKRLEALFPKEGKQFKKIAKKVLPVGQDFKPFEYGREVGRAIEEQARVLDFVANLKKTGDVTLAAQRTKQFLFDYSALTPFERNVMKRLLPFYTFTRKNIEQQVRTLFTTPGRIGAEVQAVRNLGEVISGGELTPEEEAALPDWIKSGISLLVGKRGSTVELLSAFGTPLEQPFQAIQPNQLLGSISPLIRIPVEQMSGYSFFHGKALSDVTNAAAFKRAPKAVKDFIGYTEIKGKRKDGTEFIWYTALRPERMNLILNLPPTTRVLTALKQIESSDVSTQNRIMQQLVGVKPYSFDIEKEAEKRENELKAKLETLLTKAGVTAQFKRTYVPKQNN